MNEEKTILESYYNNYLIFAANYNEDWPLFDGNKLNNSVGVTDRNGYYGRK